MGITRFDHAAVNARNIQKSKDFYCGLLGLKEGKKADMGDVILHYLELPDGSAIELFERKNPSEYDSLATQEGFLKHIAFRVDDIESKNQKLKEAGTAFDMELCELEPLGVMALLCLDPDGVVVELSQPK